MTKMESSDDLSATRAGAKTVQVAHLIVTGQAWWPYDATREGGLGPAIS